MLRAGPAGAWWNQSDPGSEGLTWAARAFGMAALGAISLPQRLQPSCIKFDVCETRATGRQA